MQTRLAVRRLAVTVLVVLAAGACSRSGSPPQAPATESSSKPIPVKGTEKIAWNQAADSASQLGHYRYVGYVDDMPETLADATCAATPSSSGTFPCTAKLPKMSPGTHRFQIGVEEMDGPERHGPRSGPLILVVEDPSK